MRRYRGLGALFLVTAAPAAASPGLCDEAGWRAQFAGALSCVATRDGIAIAATGEAATLASVIDEASDRYAAAFAPPGKPIAVVAGGSLTRDQGDFLRAHGYIPFPWISGDQRRTLAAGAIRAQIVAQHPELSPEQRDAAVAGALAQRSSDPGGARERGALAHELGHMWFRDMFDRTPAPASEETRYGSAAPDWIDEMAAILVENDQLTEQRRAALSRYVAGSGTDGLYPLAEYLTMEHPVLRAAEARQAVAGTPVQEGGSRVMVLSGADAQKLTGTTTPIRFYVQSRGFADFLIERSAEPHIFDTIAKALSRGQGFEDWLRRDGKRHRLPSTLAELNLAWEAWAKAR
ncbi:hypothetical protein [Sphingomonas sp. dw_22]|uniref:hypothetical protein n=1 Tax=Sphingomonas sp. dw_22 TaxID=2721175 RepID=UPI001BD2DAE5|nr:hypothetical protein [Sphingomonas sp. dw_22]